MKKRATPFEPVMGGRSSEGEEQKQKPRWVRYGMGKRDCRYHAGFIATGSDVLDATEDVHVGRGCLHPGALRGMDKVREHLSETPEERREKEKRMQVYEKLVVAGGRIGVGWIPREDKA